MYGFEGEVKAKYDVKVMELFTEIFNAMPLAAVVNGKVRRRYSAVDVYVVLLGCTCRTRDIPTCGCRRCLSRTAACSPATTSLSAKSAQFLVVASRPIPVR
jgi:hypothetical protein